MLAMKDQYKERRKPGLVGKGNHEDSGGFDGEGHERRYALPQ